MWLGGIFAMATKLLILNFMIKPIHVLFAAFNSTWKTISAIQLDLRVVKLNEDFRLKYTINHNWVYTFYGKHEFKIVDITWYAGAYYWISLVCAEQERTYFKSNTISALNAIVYMCKCESDVVILSRWCRVTYFLQKISWLTCHFKVNHKSRKFQMCARSFFLSFSLDHCVDTVGLAWLIFRAGL